LIDNPLHVYWTADCCGLRASYLTLAERRI